MTSNFPDFDSPEFERWALTLRRLKMRGLTEEEAYAEIRRLELEIQDLKRRVEHVEEFLGWQDNMGRVLKIRMLEKWGDSK